MLLQDGTAPGAMGVMPFAALDFSRGDYGDEIGLEGGFLMGLGGGVGLGTSVGFMDEEGEDWRYSSVSPYLTVPLFSSDSVPWLNISVYAGYQFAPEPDRAYRYETRYVTVTETVDADGKVVGTTVPAAKGAAKPVPAEGAGKSIRHTGGGGGGTGPDAPSGGHDHPVGAAPVAGQTATTTTRRVRVPQVRQVEVTPNGSNTGIHRHGEEGMVARLIARMDLTDKDQLVFNFINFTPRYGHVGWGYAAGYRHSFNHDLAVSLEAVGDFDSTGDHEVLGAVHYALTHHLIIKLGAGIGVGNEAPDFILNTGFVMRF